MTWRDSLGQPQITLDRQRLRRGLPFRQASQLPSSCGLPSPHTLVTGSLPPSVSHTPTSVNQIGGPVREEPVDGDDRTL